MDEMVNDVVETVETVASEASTIADDVLQVDMVVDFSKGTKIALGTVGIAGIGAVTYHAAKKAGKALKSWKKRHAEKMQEKYRCKVEADKRQTVNEGDTVDVEATEK